MKTVPSRTVELLAPAGDPRALRAALAAGADAVYFGLERWSARAFAGNFAADACVAAIEQAHVYGARAYLALNTLLKEDELGPAVTALEAPYAAGLDALIVADLGLVRQVRAAYPDLPLHASTQLNTHSSAQLAALARLGFARAILARELSLTEIAALEAAGLELEAFVHGALCYGYSGNCLLSSMVGGRSGNRGRCSQACRLRYAMRRVAATTRAERDVRETAAPAPGGSPRETGSVLSGGASDGTGSLGRIMSTSDVAAIGALPRLLASGVTALKIEGRMKDAAYVGLTTAVYREALDEALSNPDGFAVRAEWTARLEQSFSRGFTTAHLDGRHTDVRSGGRGSHRGVLVGRVARHSDALGVAEIRLNRPVSAGDLVYLYTPWGQTEPQRLEQGGETTVTLRVRERVAEKDRLFRLAAADTDELARTLVAGSATLMPTALSMRLTGEEGRAPVLTVIAADDPRSVTTTSSTRLCAARTAGLTDAKARDALGALGGTPYRLGALAFELPPGLFLAVADLKELRRRAVAALDERRVSARRRRRPGSGGSSSDALASLDGAVPVASEASSAFAGPVAIAATPSVATPPPAAVLVLRPGERALRSVDVEALCLDVRPGDAAGVVRRSIGELRGSGLELRMRLPEIVFDADWAWLRATLALGWDAVYVRHLGALAEIAARDDAGAVTPYLLEYPLQGLNHLAAEAAAGVAKRPPAAIVVSPEASLADVTQLASSLAAGLCRLAPTPALAAVVFGRQQVLRARDQLGRAEELYAALGPTAQVSLELEDAKGYRFPAEVDRTGTRLYNARLTNLTANLSDLRAAGVSSFLVVQSDMNEEERRAFAAGGLEALAPLASRDRTTTGHLFRGVD